MNRIVPLATAALLWAALPALAASSTSSAVSDSVSVSVGSVSTSFEKSSNSSSRGRAVAEGEYRVIELAAAEQRPGLLRLKLQALDRAGAEGELLLYLPPPAAERGALATGQRVMARTRPYGVEFASEQGPFFLVLEDAWHRELQTRPVTL